MKAIQRLPPAGINGLRKRDDRDTRGRHAD